MRVFKAHSLLKLINSYLIDSPQPSNINFWWNFGSLLASCLVIQIITGVTLAMHYNANVLEAFNSVEHIMRDVNNGWLIRYLHSNTASAFFFIVYLHIGRGLYYGSYKAPRTLVWTIGTIIFILMMATAFLGYVLPYGQMSLWGATVITSLMSAIPWVGQDIVELLWGGFSVNNATLNRFFALHFVLPLVLAALALMHLIVLHDSAGSGNPLGASANYDRLPFAPYYIFKDLITLFLFILVLSMFVFFMPNLLGDSENYVMANAMQTPPAIVPEWYLLPFYAILRSIPNKLLGVIAMFSAILILLVMPFTDLSRSRGTQFKPLSKAAFFMFVGNFLILMELGAKHVESPFIEFGQVSTVVYFAYFLIIVPLISLLENTFIEIDSKKNVIHYMKHATVVSGSRWSWKRGETFWWQNVSAQDEFFKLFSQPFPSTLQELIKQGWIKEKFKTQHHSARGNNVYYHPLRVWVREDGMVSPNAPLPEEQHGNRKPFKWYTQEKYASDFGANMEQLKDHVGIGEESKKAFEQAKKRYKEAMIEREEAIKQLDIENNTNRSRWRQELYDKERDHAYIMFGEDKMNKYSNTYKYDPSAGLSSSGKSGPSSSGKSDPSSGPSSSGNSGSTTGTNTGTNTGSTDGFVAGPPYGSAAGSRWRTINNNLLPECDTPRPSHEHLLDNVMSLIIGLKGLPHSISIYLYIILFALVSYLRIKSFMYWYKNNKCIITSIPVVLLLGIKSYLYNYKKIIIIFYIICMSFASLTLLYPHIDTSIFTGPILHSDAPRPWGIYFQDSATPQMEALVELHDNILFYLVIILFAVGWLLISIVKSYSNTESPLSNKYLGHGTLIELIWTITPALILILIAFPSFKLLYLMDEVSDPAMVVLAEGHQWYWSYQYPDFLNSDDEFLEFDSYLVPEPDLEDGALRMLEVDNRLIIPELTHVRFITTGADVIHSMACPALGIKCDAYPGRLNQTSVMINREGVFYGQCSEICGILHSSMPLVIESVSIDKFISWLKEQ